MSSPLTLDPDALGQLDLLRGLARAEVEAIGRAFHRQEMPRGRHLFYQEQPGEAVFLVLSGSVKVYATQRDGHEAISAILGIGELVGASCLVEGRSYAVSAVAQERTTLLTMARESFLAHLRATAALSFNLNRILARRLRLAHDRAQLLARASAAERLACLLLTLAREYGQPAESGVRIPLHMTQSDIAGLAGISRAHTNQVLIAFRRSHLVARDALGYLTVLDPSALGERCLFSR